MSWFVALPVTARPWFEGLAPPNGLGREFEIDLHLTIAFFGAVDEAPATRAFELTRSWPVTIGHATLARLAPLGNPRHPSVLAALLDRGEGELTSFLAAHRDALYDAAAVARDTRSALPHVTLARFGRRASKTERAAGIAWAREANVAGAAIELGPPALYRSAHSEGRRYVYSR